MTDRARTGRLNKSRAKAYEREVAVTLGGRRHPADTGGAEDVEHADFAIQVKSGGTVATNALREGMASAKVAAVGSLKLPAVVLIDRRGNRLGRYIVFELEAFAAWHGYGADLNPGPFPEHDGRGGRVESLP